MSEVRDQIREQIPALRRYARALMRDRDGADDLVQDTLLRAINAEHQWQPGTNLRAWLFTILHNVYVGDRRKLARRPSVVPIDSEDWRLEAPSNQVSSVELGELDRAIAALPEHQRVTLLLVGLQGMAYEEVAKIMDVPLGTVRSRLSRARAALQQQLGVTVPATPGPENETAA
jgi:RNA polymerase sigma-70 factor (ECF subfamily)